MVAVVRSFTPDGNTTPSGHFMQFYNAQTGAQLPLSACSSGPNVSYGLLGPVVGTASKAYPFSDLVAINNSRAIIVGSAFSQVSGADETHVYVVDIGQSPPSPACLAQHVFVSTGETAHFQAHDVAITPDGMWAVVNEALWWHVFNLRTGALVLSRQHGGQVDSMVDSVEVTNDRAVVVYYKAVSNQVHTFVDLIDLLGASGPVQMTSTSHPNYSDWASGPLQSTQTPPFFPHDLSITRDGLGVAISMDRGVAAYRLSDGYLMGAVGDGQDRNYPGAPASGLGTGQADSVEATLTEAVAIGFTTPVGGTLWQVNIVALNLGGATPTIAPSAVFPSTEAGSEPHDLAVTTSAGNDINPMALVSANGQAIVITGVAGGAAMEVFATAPAGAQSIVVSGYSTAPKTRVSDSAFFAPPPILLPPNSYNAVISGTLLNPATNQDQAAVMYFPISAGVGAAGASATYLTLGDTSGANATRCADMAVIPLTSGLALRSSAPPDQLDANACALGGRDYIQFKITNPVATDPASFDYQYETDFGGSGTTWAAVDSVVAARFFIASVGERLTADETNPIQCFVHHQRAK